MKTYILIDYLNLAWRVKHGMFSATIDTQVGMTFHTILNSIRHAYKMFGADHLVVCLEGKSWRKQYYTPYKMNRVVKQMEKTAREKEDDEIFFEALGEFSTFLQTKTNATVIQCPVAEADDLIAIFIQSHPDDNHIIISTDSDYYQMLADNVKIYNGVTEETITLEGFFDKKGRRIVDKKTKEPKPPACPEFTLFEKCIRGDKSDNIFSAYPGVRMVGSKKKVGIMEAYNDRHSKGFDYNNFMLQKWTDEKGVEHRVMDRYLENKRLVDLTQQPDDVRLACVESIMSAVDRVPVSNVGIHFLRFCKTHALDKISQFPDEFAAILNAKYK